MSRQLRLRRRLSKAPKRLPISHTAPFAPHLGLFRVVQPRGRHGKARR